MTKPHNPPLFPQGKPTYVYNGADNSIKQVEGEVPYVGGATLRDLFAAAALQGMLSSGHQAPLEQLTVLQGEKPAYGVALAAYGFADSMLKAREVEND